MIYYSPARRRKNACARQKDRRVDTIGRRGGRRTPEAGDALPCAPPLRKSLNSLAADYNRPFRGAFKIESETVTASLRQLRETLSPYCDVSGCVVPESADESSGFGGIISPPWWDDFQEP